MGIPLEQHDRYRTLVEGLAPFNSGAGPGLNDAVEPAARALEQMISYFDELVDERRRDPRDDLISAMAALAQDRRLLVSARRHSD